MFQATKAKISTNKIHRKPHFCNGARFFYLYCSIVFTMNKSEQKKIWNEQKFVEYNCQVVVLSCWRYTFTHILTFVHVLFSRWIYTFSLHPRCLWLWQSSNFVADVLVLCIIAVNELIAHISGFDNIKKEEYCNVYGAHMVVIERFNALDKEPLLHRLSASNQ